MTLINDFMSLIYPRHCEACGNGLFSHEAYICNHCKINLPRGNYTKNTNNELVLIFAGRVPLELGLSVFLYEKSGKVQRLLHAIKYQQQKEMALFFGEFYGRELEKDAILHGVDCVIPIPLHKNKLKLRGYNQSEWFANGIANKIEKPIDVNSLVRFRDTETQTKKRKYQRWENVEGIFKVTNADALKNKHVLLVDDVVTTGATIEAAWLALKDIEGIKVSLICIAFAARKLAA